MRSNSVSIQNPRPNVANGISRVTARVDGEEIWFESRDVSLRASTEAFASALLIPALFQNRCLQLNEAVCPKWQHGAASAVSLASRWWQLPLQSPESATLPSPLRTAATGIALCFTGGVDSFHCLLRGKHRPTTLVFVHGYDIALGDGPRFRAFASSLQQIATQYGAKPVTVATNLREHPLLKSAPWIHTHGGALAAIGHLLGDQVSKTVVASSVPRTYNIPWGSHWELDPLWSSGAMEFIHDGDEFAREEKLWAIAGEPLLTQHLRVCWENRTPSGNCSVCDKCINTMLLLRQAGHLEAYTVFQKPQSFVPLLDALPQTTFVRVYRAMCQRGLAPEIEAAVQRLLQRTELQAARQSRRKRVRKFLERIGLRRSPHS